MGEPLLGLNAASGRAIDPEEAGVNDWFNAVKPLILDEVEEHGEAVPVNRPEILSALAFMNFGLYQWTHRLPIIPENWMIALYRGLRKWGSPGTSPHKRACSGALTRPR